MPCMRGSAQMHRQSLGDPVWQLRAPDIANIRKAGELAVDFDVNEYPLLKSSAALRDCRIVVPGKGSETTRVI